MTAQLPLWPPPAQQDLPVIPFPLALPDRATMPHRPLILLDLNYTLVANSEQKRRQKGSYLSKVLVETYRQWLVDLLANYHVILYTVRFMKYREATMARLEAATDWLPQEAYFNETGGYDAPAVKGGYLNDFIFPVHGGPDETPYLALESNRSVRSYLNRKDINIPALPVPKAARWDTLPGHDLDTYIL